MNFQKLQKPDALMNPDVQTYIDEYIDSGGDITSMITFLSDGYKGNFHIIEAFATVLKELGCDFRSSFEAFLMQNILQSFNPKKADILFDPKSPPEWISRLASNSFWVSVVNELLKKYPTSNFLLYCMERICELSPELVTSIPPCHISYKGYFNVIINRIALTKGQKNVNRSSFKTLLPMLVSDDLAIVYTAFNLNRDEDVSLIHAIEHFLEKRKTSQNLFLTTLMRLEHCDDKTIEILQGIENLNFETIAQLALICFDRSNFLRDFVLRRLVKDLLKPSLDDEFRNFLVKTLIGITKENSLNPDNKSSSLNLTNQIGNLDEELLVDGITCLTNWSVSSKNELSLALYSTRAKFCAIALLPVLSKKILSNEFYINDQQPPTPECLLLMEIAYWHCDLIPNVFRIVEKGINCERRNLGSLSQHRLLKELYDLISYLFSLGSYRNTLKFMTEKHKENDADIKRQTMMKMLRCSMPPFSKEFLSHMLRCLSHPDVRALFFPTKGIPALPVQAAGLEVVFRFTDRVNRDISSESDPKERPKYDELRMSARQALEIARGHKQHTINSFFK